MNLPMEDAICAIATPCGEGGIGIIRISGDKAIEIASAHTRLRSGRSLFDVTSHTLYQADIFERPVEGSVNAGPSPIFIDQGLVVVMRAPHRIRPRMWLKYTVMGDQSSCTLSARH